VKLETNIWKRKALDLMGQWGLHECCCDWRLEIFSRPKTAYCTAEDSRSLAQLHFSEWESKSYSRRTKYS